MIIIILLWSEHLMRETQGWWKQVLAGVHYQEYATPLFLYRAAAAMIMTELRQQTAAIKEVLGRVIIEGSGAIFHSLIAAAVRCGDQQFAETVRRIARRQELPYEYV